MPKYLLKAFMKWQFLAKKLSSKASKNCQNGKKSPNLVTLIQNLIRFLCIAITYSKFKLPPMRVIAIDKTSNDIIAGNGRILSVHDYCVVIFVLKIISCS